MSSLKLINILKEDKISSLDEQGARQFLVGFSGDAKAFRRAKPGIAAAFDEVLSFAQTDRNQIKGYTKSSPNALVTIDNLDDLLYALRTEGAMGADVLGLLNQGLLKAKQTPIDLIDGITKEVVATQSFRGRYASLTDGQMREKLRAAGYSDNAVESFMRNAKKDPNFKSAFKRGVAKRQTASGKEKNLTPKGDNSKVPPQQKKTLIDRAREIMDMVKVKKMTWRQLLPWAAGIGVGAFALWWFLHDSGDVVPDDMPETEPTDTGEWAPCIKELIDSKEGVIMNLDNGITVVRVVTPEYPEGLNFTSNGRVADVATKKMGSWKCKEGQITIQEQSDTETVGREVRKGALVNSDEKTIVDTIIKNASTKQSFENFLGQFKQKYNVDLAPSLGGTISPFHDQEEWLRLQNHLKGIGVTFNWDSKKGHPTFDGVTTNSSSVNASGAVAQGAVDAVQNRIGLKNIDITWDGGGTPPRTSIYHDCNGKELPHEFGCRSEQIKQVQICLGLPEKYQTGNFGPITKKAIEDKNVSLSNGLSQDVINQICGTGDEGGGVNRVPADLSPIATERLKMSDLAMPKVDMKLPNIKAPEVTPAQFYNALKDYGNIVGEDGNNRIKYKGPDLDETQLGKLDSALSEMGYTRIKQLEDMKRYGSKYVWLRQ
jgi:hypothetical protein